MSVTTMRVPVDEITAEANSTRIGFGRAVAVAITAVFVAAGWLAGATWYGFKHCLVSIRYGYRQGARIQRVPVPPPDRSKL
jgi:hypothetical protein